MYHVGLNVKYILYFYITDAYNKYFALSGASENIFVFGNLVLKTRKNVSRNFFGCVNNCSVFPSLLYTQKALFPAIYHSRNIPFCRKQSFVCVSELEKLP